MMSTMANHLWQSTLFALAAGVLALALRQNRARVRYWLWLAASVKFLVPCVLLIDLGGRLAWPPVVQSIAPAAPPTVSMAVDQIAQPFTAVFTDAAAPVTST